MYSPFQIGIILPAPARFTGTAIVLQGVHRVPPHLALVHRGLYYAVTVHGIQTGIVFDEIVIKLKRAVVPSVYFEILNGNELSAPFPFFHHYATLARGMDVTCLFPIRDWLAARLHPSFSSCNLVTNVHKTLKNLAKLGNTYGTGIKNISQPLVLPGYSLHEVKEELLRHQNRMYA